MIITEHIDEHDYSGAVVATTSNLPYYCLVGPYVYIVRPYEQAMSMENPDTHRVLRSGNTKHRPFWRGLKRYRKT